jgi:RNA polymerase sigma factor (sigma-70 family)
MGTMSPSEGRSDDPARPEAARRAEGFFLAQLAAIERAIRFACHHGGLHDEEANDFASHAKLKMIENDYAVIRKYEARSSFMAFISVVVQRMLLDYRIANWGRWHASTSAQRLGDVGITIEAMIVRDGKTIDQALPALQRRWPALTRDKVVAMLEALPRRHARPRFVAIEDAASNTCTTSDTADQAAFESDRRAVSRDIATIVRAVVKEFDDFDRLILRLRFDAGMSVADISRSLSIEQKPLYRRIQRALGALRKRLEAAGVTQSDIVDIVTSPDNDLDFGLSDEDTP